MDIGLRLEQDTRAGRGATPPGRFPPLSPGPAPCRVPGGARIACGWCSGCATPWRPSTATTTLQPHRPMRGGIGDRSCCIAPRWCTTICPASTMSPLRRGKPSVHAAFGERLAVLAGDALIVLGFEWLALPDGAAGAAGRGSWRRCVGGPFGHLRGPGVGMRADSRYRAIPAGQERAPRSRPAPWVVRRRRAMSPSPGRSWASPSARPSRWRMTCATWPARPESWASRCTRTRPITRRVRRRQGCSTAPWRISRSCSKRPAGDSRLPGPREALAQQIEAVSPQPRHRPSRRSTAAA